MAGEAEVARIEASTDLEGTQAGGCLFFGGKPVADLALDGSRLGGAGDLELAAGQVNAFALLEAADRDLGRPELA